MFDFFGAGTRASFYLLLQQQAEAAHRSAVLLRQLTVNFGQAAELAKQIEAIRTEAQELAHQLRIKTASTFVTPLDKEDLEGLGTALDAIANAILVTTLRIHLFQVAEPLPDFVELARVLDEITIVTQEAVTGLASLRDMDRWVELLKQIRQLELDGDIHYRQGLARLFISANPDPVLIVKWKDVYDWVEEAIDRCLRVGEIVETVLLKYA